MSDYVHPETLVDADWVAQHIDHPNIRLIDVDEDTTAYEQGHIPKAVGWHWFTDLHDPVRRDYVDREGLSRLLQQAGVGPDTTVVLYGGSNNWFAAYAYWLCRYLGFDAVKLLDGGRKRWELDGRALTPDVPALTPTDFQVTGPVRAELRARRDEVLAKLGPGAVDRRPLTRGVPGRAPRARARAAGAGPCGAPGAGPHPRRAEHPLEQGRQR